MSRRGSVWFETTRVGRLIEGDRGSIRFTYDEAWLRSGFGISLSVPLSYGELDAHEFFAGLLPEGLARERVCRRYKLPDDDDLGLLLAIGRDCAGALAVFPDDEAPPRDEPSVPVTEDDLVNLVESHGQALPAAAERPRFSLAGAQNKLAVRIDDTGTWLPNWRQPSSHILKFETTKWVCFAEFAAGQLARGLGLCVPEARFFRRGDPPTPYLRIPRFDREVDATGALRRLHQEDMTQALGISRLLKYQEHGGPSLGQIATLVRRHSSQPIVDIAALRDWQVLNYLIGNSDAHAKNLALLYDRVGMVPKLAPFYDLVCIEYLNRLGMHFDRKLAFFVGANNEPERITREDWEAHAKAIGVPASPLLERLREIATALPELAASVRSDFATEFGDNPVLDRFEESIRDRSNWTLRSVFGRG